VSPQTNRTASTERVQLSAALRAVFREGYRASDLRADLMAGCVVGVVALPLSMALAIASGVPPQHGLYTAIVAGGLIAALGGSRFQISGPTAAFVVILVPISTRYGLGGLAVASVFAGLMLLAMGLARFGRFLQFVPQPVTTGFTAGIGVVIATLQLKDFFGLTVAEMPETYAGKVRAILHAAPSFSWADLAIGAMTLTVLLVWPRLSKRVPGPLVALLLAAVTAALLTHLLADFSVATIGSRFADPFTGQPGIPQRPPLPIFPWHLPGPGGAPLVVSLQLLEELARAGVAIALLGAIESLLSATVADGMTGYQHDPNAELVAQGVGNIVAPFFGGFAATGAIARTATGVRSGARSPVTGIAHAAFVLLAVLLFAPLMSYLPMASLAALLMLVAWNMSEAKFLIQLVRVAPKSDVFVLFTCFGLTVAYDMVVSVSVGIVLAALLFMQRMAEVSDVKLIGGEHPHLDEPLPEGVIIYEIAGPLFFGAAQRAMGALHTTAGGVRVVVLDLRSVPAMDATGMMNLKAALSRLAKNGVQVIIAGLQSQPAGVLERAGLVDRPGQLLLRRSFAEGVALARQVVAGTPAPVPTPTRAAS
jgi:sulfate permease, SulP family